jgi:hypothetical protein
MQTDNFTAAGFSNSIMKPSKAMDIMHYNFYWVQSREQQERQFIIYWCPESENLRDSHTKHRSASHHQLM